MKHVAVIGGGFAGLSAAVRLTQLGHKVTLFERRHHLGGRTFSFTDPTTGDTVDNGQHLFMKCYRETLQFLQAIHAHTDIVFQPQFHIEFRHPEQGISHLTFPSYLPSPLNILAGFLRFISWKDMLPLLNLKAALKEELPNTLSVTRWLDQCRQTFQLRQVFWHPLCLAALNEPPDQAPARHLQAVLREAFFTSTDGALLGYAKMGLSNLFANKAQAFLENHGQSVLLGQPVQALSFSSPDHIELTARSSQKQRVDAVISALPPHVLHKLVPQSAFPNLYQTLLKFRPSPILSVNLWFDRPILNRPFIGMLGTQMEWAFNKALLYNKHDQASDGHVTLVASAARDLSQKSHATIIQIAHTELQAIEPAARQAHLIHARVICEHRATQTLPLGQCTPSMHTAHPRFFLAGDWTDTGLPATIESAVRSGNLAAQAVHTLQA